MAKKVWLFLLAFSLASTYAKHINNEKDKAANQKEEDVQDGGDDFQETLQIVIIAASGGLAFAALIIAGACYYHFKGSDYDLDTSYEATFDPINDRKMAISAQMHHYQMQKQQIIDKEKAIKKGCDVITEEDEESNEEESVVYQCPGLAVEGTMSVNNPIFAYDDSSNGH